MRRPETLGVAAAATAVAVWGASSVLIKQVDGASGFAVSFHRLWIGAAVLVAVHLARGRRITLGLLRTCLPGGLAFGADIVLFFIAVQETTVANATIIGALQPVLVLALAPRLFGERPQWLDVVLSVIAIGGAAIVVAGAGDAGERAARGDLLAVAALLAWTWYFVASKRARVTLGSLEYLTGLSVVAVLALAPAAIVFAGELSVPHADGWLVIALIALINGALGHILMNWAHAHVPLVVTSLLTLAIPVFAAAAAAVFLDERVTGTQVAGMAVVITSLAGVVVHQSRSPMPAVSPDVAPADAP